ncbi:L-serine ammonia-lyase [Roseomonas hellenica]|uniref:L-serine dehydratase n=1 Tax=Plastoroseomonas hellenica TaxID=2687306 RepID=A0ABS5EY91_9PROT|nr:L-serine ammonia-lyase [Plastoroseomonas hellenica]MBR0665257.1 L-serine ammonia-lyase [Plastoroseomonas hellenica]
MDFGAFDIFRIGIGPSSSHTVGPMRAAAGFARGLAEKNMLGSVARVLAEVFGSLALTGRGHATDIAILLGLSGETPEHLDPDAAPGMVARIRAEGRLPLAGRHLLRFTEAEDLLMHRGEVLPGHTNGMRFTGFDAAGAVLDSLVCYSIGGGFVATAQELAQPVPPAAAALPYAFGSGQEMLAMAAESGLGIAAMMRENEQARGRATQEVDAGLRRIRDAMRDCIERGMRGEGQLPGRMHLRRRAAALHRDLLVRPRESDPMIASDWVSLFAIAVNEENAAGGRVVTAPTNGAAGIVPAVMHYYERFVTGATEQGVFDLLLTAAAIGVLYKRNASISGAEVGCQGEVGVACSMAAAGLAAAMGGTPAQVENAAEIGMEHNLGLTCDPVGGLVQIPCIERNALGANKAIIAARLALRGDGAHHVSLDDVIRTMRQTGIDMQSKYKETSLGGLAVNVTEC